METEGGDKYLDLVIKIEKDNSEKEKEIYIYMYESSRERERKRKESQKETGRENKPKKWLKEFIINIKVERTSCQTRVRIRITSHKKQKQCNKNNFNGRKGTKI